MSVSYIPSHVIGRLWGHAGGRCEYRGCNHELWKDDLTQAEFNKSYVAHIVADKPDGPRGHPELSEKLSTDLTNLMLLCDAHHRLIDKHDIEGHPVDLLTEMKREHEQRIELVTGIQSNARSHVLLYGANIGGHSAHVSWQDAAGAMKPEKFPAEKPAIELSLKNSSSQDRSPEFWKIEREQLNHMFESQVRRRIKLGEISHISVFALAPQPLLVDLGRLLGDVTLADVYQRHREPSTWCWQPDNGEFSLKLRTPPRAGNVVALNLSLSATINDSRIHDVLGDDVSVWTLYVESPHNDILRAPEHLRSFRNTIRRTFDQIKSQHGEGRLLHVFPAMPVSSAVELGRTWMPKADLPLRLYDQNRELNGFVHAFDIQ